MVLLKLKVHVSKAPSPGTVIQQERIVHSIIGVQVHPHACKDLKVYLNVSIKHLPFQGYLLRDWRKYRHKLTCGDTLRVL